jgi:hypothetical protein
MKNLFTGERMTVTLTGVDTESDPRFEGFAVYRGNAYAWSALPTLTGYVVDVYKDTRRSMWFGPTLNLGLEVAAAVKQH